MKAFWKQHPAVRVVLMAACFVLAVVFTIFGWKQTGEMAGLVWMLVGIGLLLAALAVYNSPFADHGDQK